MGFIAAIQTSQGEFETSLSTLQEALEILNGISAEDMSEEISKMNCSIAGVWLKIKKHEKALEHLTNALAMR